MTSDAVLDKVQEAFAGRGMKAELVQTNLPMEQEAEVREMLAAE